MRKSVAQGETNPQYNVEKKKKKHNMRNIYGKR